MSADEISRLIATLRRELPDHWFWLYDTVDSPSGGSWRPVEEADHAPDAPVAVGDRDV
jgi:hypothetical protein